VLTERLEIRRPEPDDRGRFVELFGDPEFMVFSDGVHDFASANARFDVMLATAREVPFGKQPVIERATDRIIGYTGVAWFDFEDERRLEYGYRLVPDARGRGYATEAGLALLALADETFRGELLAMIDPTNTASQNVIAKLGFTYWKQGEMDDWIANLYRRSFA
jgi:RimJ/RimL family protein N-acetyltransferase